MRSLDISNGENLGVSLFVQGCPFMCKNCFNTETWDFNGGKEWTEETKKEFFKLIDRPYIKRISLLGGECLAEHNLDEVLNLVEEIRVSYPEKTIWLYTGYELSTAIYFDRTIFTFNPSYYHVNPLNGEQIKVDDKAFLIKQDRKRIEILKNIDVMVDGQYIDSQRDITLKWRGSANQRVIDVRKSLAEERIILYGD